MELDERIGWFLLGLAVGGILGYIVAILQDIKAEVDDVDKQVKRNRQNESGFSRNPVVLNVLLLFVVALTAWGAFASQRASNEVQQTQEAQRQITVCNRIYLQQTIIALNQRTSYVQDQAISNIRLQEAQKRFFGIIFENPRNDKVELQAFRDYFRALKDFVKVNQRLAKPADFNPYPTARELTDCLNR